jgi:hypothetical protein
MNSIVGVDEPISREEGAIMEIAMNFSFSLAVL